MTSSDASVSFDIDGLPVVLVLPERDVEMIMWLYQVHCILQEGCGDE